MVTEGYKYSKDQRALLKEALEFVSHVEGEPFYLEFGNAENFDGVRIGIEGHNDQPLFSIHSAPTSSGVIFVFLRLGPAPNFDPIGVTQHNEFSDAVKQMKQAALDFLGRAKAPFRELRIPLFSEKDQQILAGLAGVIEKSSGKQSFIKFQDVSSDSQACAIGIIEKGQPVLVATFVSVYTRNGTECSVRNFENQTVPGMPSVFPSVAQAIAQHQDYFTFIVKAFRNRPWWKRLFS